MLAPTFTFGVSRLSQSFMLVFFQFIGGQFVQEAETNATEALNTLAYEWPDIIKFSAYFIRNGNISSSAEGEFEWYINFSI